MPANILNLPQYRVLRVEETDHDYHVTAEPVDVSSSCPHCQSDRLTSWGTRQQVFKDLPAGSRARQGPGAAREGPREPTALAYQDDQQAGCQGLPRPSPDPGVLI